MHPSEDVARGGDASATINDLVAAMQEQKDPSSGEDADFAVFNVADYREQQLGRVESMCIPVLRGAVATSRPD